MQIKIKGNKKEICDFARANNMRCSVLKDVGGNGLDECLVSFKNSDILDNSEIVKYNLIRQAFKDIKIGRFSKMFVDLHKLEGTAKFKKALEIIREKIKPMYITKNNCWWIGVENSDAFDISSMTKEIYKIGMGMGLVPADFTR